MIAQGNYPAFVCEIMPFAERLDVRVTWLFYAVPAGRQGNIDTVFTDRFWDDRDRWFPPGVGVVPNSLRPYFGPLPPPDLGPLFGTPDEWLNGLDFTVWQNNGYAETPCWEVSEYLMLENRRLLLQEDGNRIQIEH